MVSLVGLACSRGSLQGDAGGAGRIGIDAGPDPAAFDGSHPSAGDGPIGAIDAQVPTADANCGITSVAGALVPAETLLVLDRSIDGDQSASRNLLATIVDQINRSAPAVDWGLYVFPKDGPACGPATGPRAPTSGLAWAPRVTSSPMSRVPASTERAG